VGRRGGGAGRGAATVRHGETGGRDWVGRARCSLICRDNAAITLPAPLPASVPRLPAPIPASSQPAPIRRTAARTYISKAERHPPCSTTEPPWPRHLRPPSLRKTQNAGDLRASGRRPAADSSPAPSSPTGERSCW
jgi:hypothetical protein